MVKGRARMDSRNLRVSTDNSHDQGNRANMDSPQATDKLHRSRHKATVHLSRGKDSSSIQISTGSLHRVSMVKHNKDNMDKLHNMVNLLKANTVSLHHNKGNMANLHRAVKIRQFFNCSSVSSPNFNANLVLIDKLV